MESIDFQSIIFGFLGGLGLFLFSIKYMGDGLKLMAGDKIRYVLDKYTTNPFLGVLVGIFVTVLLQSSSASTVITVGLVSVGLLNLKQAIGIVMGANIGTTITSFIIGFDLSEYSLPIMFLGAACLFFTTNQKINNIGRSLFGFGGIFFSLTMMSDAMIPLRGLEDVQNFLVYVGNKPIYGVFLGTVITLIIQSSAAIIGIIQNLYTDNLLTIHGSLPILYGSNIGTTITAILSVIGANVAAKRVAATHVLFNVIGTIIFMIVLTPFTNLMIRIESYLNLNPKLTIATAHGLFNAINTVLMFPFIGVLTYIVIKLIPSNEEEEEKREHYLDKSFVNKTPLIALSQAKKELMYMYRITSKNFMRSIEYFIVRKTDIAEKIERNESLINEIDHDITKYLSEVFSERLTEKESESVSIYLDVTRDVERIGDHANNLAKEVTYQINKGMEFSKFAIDEILTMKEIIKEMLDLTYENLDKRDKKNLSEIYRLHNEIYAKEHRYRKNHIERIKMQECDIKAGMQYVDVLNHMTRVCDHLKNVNEKL